MAVKATDQITITDMTDVKSFCRYYLLQSSTLSAPSKPTTNPPPSTWAKTEPGYTAGSTNSLYFTDLTVYSNDTFIYSDVSLSSSYEAAKTAYNKATEAAKTATNFIDFTEADGLQVGNKQSGSWVGPRAQIKSGVFQIVSETGSRIAQFASTLIEIGRNQADALIQLCGGKGKICTDTYGVKIGDGWVNIESNGGIYSIEEPENSGGMLKPGKVAWINTGKISLNAKNYGGTAHVRFEALASGGDNLSGEPDTATIESILTKNDVTNKSSIKVKPESVNIATPGAVNIEAENVNVNSQTGIDLQSDEILFCGVPVCKRLWENPSPTASFGAQTITVEDMSRFDFIMIEYALTNSNPRRASTIVSAGSSGTSLFVNGSGSGGRRHCTFTDNTTIEFDSYSSGSANNNYALPYRVYGIKLFGTLGA